MVTHWTSPPKRLVLLLLFFCFPASARGVEFIVTPASLVQGEPAMITLKDVSVSDIRTASFDGKRAALFLYRGKPTAIVGIDISASSGKHRFSVTLADGRTLQEAITVTPRRKLTAPFTIPEKLGGNTKAAQDALVKTLVKENAAFAMVNATPLPFWSETFDFPVASPVVTDAFGYLRETGHYSIPHKGTDFHADIGTPIYAINAGVVRLVRAFTVYGKTIAIDHGGGVVSLSLHLSKIAVKEGQKVKKGELIGFSGESGYALSPHLHLSVRVGGVSVDPMKFFTLFRQ